LKSNRTADRGIRWCSNWTCRGGTCRSSWSGIPRAEVGGTKLWNGVVGRPRTPVLLPTVQTIKLAWTRNSLIPDRYVVPVQALEVIATCFEDRVIENATVAILSRPSIAARVEAEGFIHFPGIAGIGKARCGKVEPGSCNIEMDLPAAAHGIAFGTQVGNLDDDSTLDTDLVDVAGSCEFVAATASRT
jgi:hypothetical protein